LRATLRESSGLVGAAEINVFDLFFVDAGFLNQLGDDKGAKIIGANVFKNSTVTSHGRAHGFYNDCVFHGFT